MKKVWIIVACIVIFPLLIGTILGAGKIGGWFEKESEDPDASESPPATEAPEDIEPHPDYMPENINGQSKYATYTLISFEDGDKQQALGNIANIVDCSSEYVEGEISDRAYSISNGTERASVSFSLCRAVDFTPYDGFLFYFDATGVKTPINNQTGISFRVFSEDNPDTYAWTRNDLDLAEGVPEIAFYYQGEDGWLKTTELYCERGMFPAEYKGWIYLPFSSFVTRDQPTTKDPVAGIYGAEKINKVECYVGPYSLEVAGENTVVVDEISLVKLGVNQKDWSIPDEMNEYYLYDNVALAYAGGYGTYGNEPLKYNTDVIVAVTGTGDVTLTGLMDENLEEFSVPISLGDTESTHIVTGKMGDTAELQCTGKVTLQIFAKLDISKYSDVEIHSQMNFAANDSVLYPYKFTAEMEAGKHYGIRVNSIAYGQELDEPLKALEDAGTLTNLYTYSVSVAGENFDSVLYCFEATESGELPFALTSKNVKVDVYEMPYVNYDGNVYLKYDTVATPTVMTVLNSDGEQVTYNGYLVEGISSGEYYLGNFYHYYDGEMTYDYVTFNGTHIELNDEGAAGELKFSNCFTSCTYLEIYEKDGEPVTGTLFFGDDSLVFEDMQPLTIYRIIGTF